MSALLAALGAVLVLSLWDGGTTATPTGAPAGGVRLVDSLLAVDALEVDAQAASLAPPTPDATAISTPAAAPATHWPDPADLLTALRTGTPLEREQAAADLGPVSRERAAAATEASATTHGLSLAASEAEAAVRQAAIESLAVIGGDSAALALDLALQDPEPRVREAAVDALGDIGGATALALLERSRNDSVEYVREAAREAIERARTAGQSRSRRD